MTKTTFSKASMGRDSQLAAPAIHLQELQVPLLQEVHPESDPAKGLSTPLIPKVDIFFLTSFDEHFGQSTSLFPKTSFSNSSLH
jgi:hypothetical protein